MFFNKCKISILLLLSISCHSYANSSCTLAFQNRFYYSGINDKLDTLNTQRKILILQNVLFNSGGEVLSNALDVNIRTLSRWKEGSDSSAKPRDQHLRLVNVFIKHITLGQPFVDPQLEQGDLTRMMDTYLSWRKKYEAKRKALLDIILPASNTASDVGKILSILQGAPSDIRRPIIETIRNTADENLRLAFEQQHLPLNFIEALDMFYGADYQLAIKSLKNITQNDAMKELATFYLATAYTRLGSFDEAYATTERDQFSKSVPLAYARFAISSIERNPEKIDLYFDQWKLLLPTGTVIDRCEPCTGLVKVFWEDPELQFARLYLFVRGKIDAPNAWGERPVQSNDEAILRQVYAIP